MRNSSRALSAALAMAFAMTASAARPEKLSLDLQLRELVQTVLDSDFKACKAQNGKLLKAAADPRFEQQIPRTRALVLYALIACAPKDGDQALVASRRLAPLPVDPRLTYVARLNLLSDARKRDAPADYLAVLDAIIDADPSLLADWEPWDFSWILDKVKDDSAQDAALLDRLHAVPWTNRESRNADRNSLAVRRARRFVEAGEIGKARVLLDQVTRTSSLLVVAQDKRFERLWPQMQSDGRFDWTRLVEAELAEDQARMKAEPNLLEPVASAIADLRGLSRYDEAVALGETYAARLRKGDTFTDAERQRAWLFNALAYAYFDIGRFDDADRVMVESIGKDQVSQTINRAEMLNLAGRPTQALKVLEDVKADDASKYGQMWVESARVCAKIQLGDKAAAETAAAAMRDRWKTNANALNRALMCLGADDEVAALYIRRLGDPVERASALEAFRDSRPSPALTPIQVQLRARHEAIIARPDVQAALLKWGRPLTLPLSGDY